LNATERLATLLLEIGERSVAATCDGFGKTSPNQFELPMSRQQIADILGLTIETVSRQFTKMREDGLIKVHGRRHVTICNRDVLETLAA
jgi:CRP/FNR family transcriptional regulator